MEFKINEKLKVSKIRQYGPLCDEVNYNGGQLMEGILLSVYLKIANGTFFLIFPKCNT